MKNNKGFALVPVLVVVLILLVVGGGVYYYETHRIVSPIQNNYSANSSSTVNIKANGSHDPITVPLNAVLNISWVAPQDSNCEYSGTGPNVAVGGGSNSAPFPPVYTMKLGPGTESVLISGANTFTIKCSKNGQNIGSDSVSVNIVSTSGPKATIESLKNATYESPEDLGSGKFYTLKNGLYGTEGGAFYVSIDSYDSNHLIYADLERNGSEDAIVLVKENGGGSGTFHSVQVMKGTDPKWVASAFLGDRPMIYDMYTTTYSTSTILSVDLVPWGDQTGKIQTFRYQLVSGKLVRIN